MSNDDAAARSNIYSSVPHTSAPGTRLRTAGALTLLIWTCVTTVARTARLPNDYAEAHWLLDYRFGFVKRGLVGTMTTLAAMLTGRAPSEAGIAAASVALFVAFCVTLVAISARVVQRSSWSATSLLVSLAFLSSPFVVMAAHVIGYFDGLVLMLTALAVWCVLNARVWSAVATMTAAIAVHESAILIGLPLVCLTALARRRQRGTEDVPLMPLLLPVAMGVAMTAGQPYLVTADFRALYSAHLAQFPYLEGFTSTLVPRWHAQPLYQTYASELRWIGSRFGSVSQYQLVMPAISVLLLFALRTWRGLGEIRLSVLLVLAVFLPQAMHFVAWDTERIWTYSIACAFLGLWICSEINPPRLTRSTTVSVLGLAVVVWHAVVLTPLMDSLTDALSLKVRLLLAAPVVAGSVVFAASELRQKSLAGARLASR